jgi:hypothetical protein
MNMFSQFQSNAASAAPSGAGVNGEGEGVRKRGNRGKGFAKKLRNSEAKPIGLDYGLGTVKRLDVADGQKIEASFYNGPNSLFEDEFKRANLAILARGQKYLAIPGNRSPDEYLRLSIGNGFSAVTFRKRIYTKEDDADLLDATNRVQLATLNKGVTVIGTVRCNDIAAVLRQVADTASKHAEPVRGGGKGRSLDDLLSQPLEAIQALGARRLERLLELDAERAKQHAEAQKNWICYKFFGDDKKCDDPNCKFSHNAEHFCKLDVKACSCPNHIRPKKVKKPQEVDVLESKVAVVAAAEQAAVPVASEATAGVAPRKARKRAAKPKCTRCGVDKSASAMSTSVEGVCKRCASAPVPANA